jgi:hypothetical protein
MTLLPLNRFALSARRFDARKHLWLLGLLSVIVFGLALRLYAAWDWNLYHPDSPKRLVGDEPGYDNLAREMLDGLGFTWPGRVPLYPLWLSGIYLFIGESYSTVTYVQAVLGALTILLTYLLGRRSSGRVAGLVAAFFAAISYVLIHQSLHLLSEVLYTPLILVIGITLWDAMAQPTNGRFGWAGFWVGISNLVRPTLVLFPFAMIVVLLAALGRQRFLRYWAVFVLVAALVIAPWIVRNYIRYNAVFPLATSNAILWQGSPEYYHMVRDQGYTYQKIWSQVLYKRGDRTNNPTSIAGDRYWTNRAIKSIASEPLVYLKYAVEKAGTYWVGDPNADWGDTYVFNYQALRRVGFTSGDAKLFMLARIIPIIALLSGLFLWRKWRTLLPLYAILGYCTLLHAATHAEARLSDPLQPLLLIIIADAAVTFVTSPRLAAWYRRITVSLHLNRKVLE